MRESRPKLVGMGVPSKYAALPVLSFGMTVVVTLNRARRVRPQSTKMERHRWSTPVRMPMQKATTAGERPNEIWRGQKQCHKHLQDNGEGPTEPSAPRQRI